MHLWAEGSTLPTDWGRENNDVISGWARESFVLVGPLNSPLRSHPSGQPSAPPLWSLSPVRIIHLQSLLSLFSQPKLTGMV